MTGLSDTSPEAERVLREAYRKMSVADKVRQMNALYRTARLLHAAGVRYRNPAATEEMIQDEWRTLTLGPDCCARSRRPEVDNNPEHVSVVQAVAAVLDRLEIAYAVGGSWASSIFGKPRFTQDIDITAEPFPGKEAPFCAAFGEDYYVDLPMIRDAIQRRSSFNIIHWASGFKVDVFVRKNRPFDGSVLARRRLHPFSEGFALPIVSPEDVILLKMEWYRIGGDASERQWNDILGVFEVQAGKLDAAHLDHWAAELGVSDLLQRARRESGV